MCYYADGTIEEEIGLQLLEVYCDTAEWETKRTPRLDRDGEPVLSMGLYALTEVGSYMMQGVRSRFV